MKRWPDFALELLCLNTDWLWETNERGELVSWRGSQRAAESGSEPELPAGAFLHWRNYLRHDYSLRDNQAKLLRALRAGEPFRCLRVACWLPHLPSMRGWLRMTGVPVHNAEGRIIGYEVVQLGKVMEAVRAGKDANEAIKANTSTKGRFADGVKFIDPREE